MIRGSNRTGRQVSLDDSKYARLYGSLSKEADFILHLESIMKYNDLEMDDWEDLKNNPWQARNFWWAIRSTLLEINQKLRTTLTPLEFVEFKAMCSHYGLFDEHFFANPHCDKELKSYLECSILLLERGVKQADLFMVIDFTDMLYLPVRWNLQPDKLYPFMFIDECQDLSKSQLGVALKHIESSGRILAVGDPSQSIYGFAGADIRSFDRVKRLTKAHDLKLSKCFRCPKKIIAKAQDLRADIVAFKEYDGIVEEIDHIEILSRVEYGDLIVSRFRAPMIFLVFEFLKANKNIRIHQDEAKEFLNEMANPFSRDEKRKALPKSREALEHYFDQVMHRYMSKVRREAQKIVEKPDRDYFIQVEKDLLESKMDFLADLYYQGNGHYNTVHELMQEIDARIQSPDPCVKLSTIHRAKGLEDDRVFILDFDRLPYKSDKLKEWELIQERNLKYVAITRAKEALYLVRSQKKEEEKAQKRSLFDEIQDQFQAE